MNKIKKILLVLFIIFLVFVIGLLTGKAIERMKYHVTFAWCEKSQLPGENYIIIGLNNSPLKKMFQNYYSLNLDFIEYYLPKNTNTESYLMTLWYGGVHYFRTSDNNIYECGFSK